MTRIDETQTPSLDILREYENRFVHDPLIEMNKKASNFKKSKFNKANRTASPKRGILRNNHENFANHTISSAIKADYNQPDVKFKLDELNQSVKKTKIIKTTPSVALARNNSSRPFVVRKVEDRLILRKPELHDVLHDGLVLVKKNLKRIKNRHRSASRSKRSRSRSNDYKFSSPSLDNLIHVKSFDHLSRSLSPHNRSLNSNIRIENDRSLSRSLSNSRRHDCTYDILPEFSDDFCTRSVQHYQQNKKFDTNLENCNICSNTHPSNCEVCEDFKFRTQKSSRAHRFHRNETSLSKVTIKKIMVSLKTYTKI